MRIGDFSTRTGLSIDTLRYYERIGLMPPPARDGGGSRQYSDDHLRWAEFLDVLKSTGMGVRDMARYCALRADGAASIGERLAMLRGHLDRVRAERRRLAQVETLLSEKITTFQAVVDGSLDPSDLTCQISPATGATTHDDQRIGARPRAHRRAEPGL
ncbi:MAG: MerR family transcriptional regulator [Pseudomonadota bacterium]